MAVRVMRTMASVGASMRGSGTSSMRTSWVPWKTAARMVCSSYREGEWFLGSSGSGRRLSKGPAVVRHSVLSQATGVNGHSSRDHA